MNSIAHTKMKVVGKGEYSAATILDDAGAQGELRPGLDQTCIVTKFLLNRRRQRTFGGYCAARVPPRVGYRRQVTVRGNGALPVIDGCSAHAKLTSPLTERLPSARA